MRTLSALQRTVEGDGPWLLVMASMAALEVVWWSVAWTSGLAPAPALILYLCLFFVALLVAMMLRAALGQGAYRCSLTSLILGTVLIGVAASFFLPLKVAIPGEIPFWLDAPIAHAERTLFGTDPYRLLDRWLGWATVPIDRIYGLWLPVQTLFLFMVILEPPSRAKSRALVAYSLSWFLLGVAAATLLSSAGPLFHDRLFGGSDFASLDRILQARGALMALSESGLMWSALATGKSGLVAGISAVPSLHVAMSLWMYLVTRTNHPRLAVPALCYFVFIWIASVQLGWHYATDGLVGSFGMLAIWWLSAAVNRRLVGLRGGRQEGNGPLGWPRSRIIDEYNPKPRGPMMKAWFSRRYLDLLGSIYIYNEHRGYTAIDRVLEAVRLKWPHDAEMIAAIEKHRLDERKHYLMFRRWFEARGVMPFAVDSTCGHIDRFVGIMFRSTIDDLDTKQIIGRTELFERMCRVISLTERRGHKQVKILLRHPVVRGDRQLMKIFRIVEKDEPSHWAPYDRWLEEHGKREPLWWERAIDSFIHSELLLVKLPVLFLTPSLGRRTHWADQHEAIRQTG